MNALEWSQLFSAAGFSVYALVLGLVLVSYLRKDTLLNLKRLVVGVTAFVVLIGVVSATTALARPPFEWISLSQAAQATAFYVWANSVIVLVGLFRRA